ncbi:MAG TPA: cytochrome c [Novosphingobium sp.]|nr:cytochrome c [Novosphingobium sp.]
MRTLHAAALAVLGLALAGTARAGQELGQTLPQRSPEKVYASTCGYCHGHNVGPIILGRHLPADMVRYMVRHGRLGMPAFRPSEITDAELNALATWVEKALRNEKESGK